MVNRALFAFQLDDATAAVLVALVAAVVAPVVLSILNNRQRRAAQIEDYARQDAVAARAEAATLAAAVAIAEASAKADNAAARIVAANDRASQAAAETARLAAATARITMGKLDQIHTLVNSTLTAAMQAEYDAMMRELAMMHEVVDLKRSAGQAPSERALHAIEATEEHLSELGELLRQRRETTTLANAQALQAARDHDLRVVQADGPVLQSPAPPPPPPIPPAA